MKESELEAVVNRVGGKIARVCVNQDAWVITMPSHEGSIEVIVIRADFILSTIALADLLKHRARIAARQFAAGDRERRLPDK